MTEIPDLAQLGWSPTLVNPRVVGRPEHRMIHEGSSRLGVRDVLDGLTAATERWNYPDIFLLRQSDDYGDCMPVPMLQHTVVDIARCVLNESTPATELPRLTSNKESDRAASHTMPTPYILEMWQTFSRAPSAKRVSHIGFIARLGSEQSLFVGVIPSYKAEQSKTDGHQSPTLYYTALDSHLAVPNR